MNSSVTLRERRRDADFATLSSTCVLLARQSGKLSSPFQTRYSLVASDGCVSSRRDYLQSWWAGGVERSVILTCFVDLSDVLP